MNLVIRLPRVMTGLFQEVKCKLNGANPGNTTWAAAGDFNVELTATNICGSVNDSELLVQSPKPVN